MRHNLLEKMPISGCRAIFAAVSLISHERQTEFFVMLPKCHLHDEQTPGEASEPGQYGANNGNRLKIEAEPSPGCPDQECYGESDYYRAEKPAPRN
jgi:hypothetical protein